MTQTPLGGCTCAQAGLCPVHDRDEREALTGTGCDEPASLTGEVRPQ